VRIASGGLRKGFLGGHHLFHNPWKRLLEDYNVLRGRIRVFVLMTTLIAPLACADVGGLLSASR
jgi:hypothetical protein